MTTVVRTINVEVIAALISGTVGLLIAIAQILELQRRRRADRQQFEQVTASETSAQRIRRLTAAMTEAADAVEEIQSEIREKTTKRRSCERKLRSKSA